MIISYKYVSHKKKSHPDAINIHAPLYQKPHGISHRPTVLGHPDHMAALFSTSMRFTPGDGHRIVPRCHEHGVQRSDLGGFGGDMAWVIRHVPIFHITQPLDSMIGINGLLDGYYFRWCPIYPSHGTFNKPWFLGELFWGKPWRCGSSYGDGISENWWFWGLWFFWGGRGISLGASIGWSHTFSWDSWADGQELCLSGLEHRTWIWIACEVL